MSACLHARAERFVPKTGHGEPIPGTWYRCAVCHDALHDISGHPSVWPSAQTPSTKDCPGCGHGMNQHSDGGCNASVRSANDIGRCECLGRMYVPMGDPERVWE